MNTVILFLVVLVEVVLSLTICRDYVAPAVLFSASFLVAILNYASNLIRWNTSMKLTTFIVLLLGITTYVLVSIIVQNLRIGMKSSEDLHGLNQSKVIFYRKIPILIFSVFEVLASYLFAKTVISVTAKYGTDGSLSSAISMYQYLSKFTTVGLPIPNYILYSYILVISSSYIFGYILVNNFCYTKKVDWFILMPLLISLVSCFLTGSRGEFIRVVITMVILYVVKQNVIVNNIKKKVKSLLSILGVVILLVISFEGLAKIMGRDASLKAYDYISVYLGAPIENLNEYLQTSEVTQNIFGSNTFREQFNWFYKSVGSTGSMVQLNPQLNYLNGYNLGNVYTTFKFFYADGQILGVIFFTALMALIIQSLYNYTKTRSDDGRVKISFLIYGYLLTGMILSFFSNRFFESLTIVFIEKIISWIILSMAFVRVGKSRTNNSRLATKN